MFYTIKENVETEIIEKKSKFIANLIKIENQQEAESIIKELKKRYYNARHNCFAYITLDEDGRKLERCSDDGEPSGTAGAPMLDLLRGSNLCNVVVVVTRYFGGILLGTGGLVKAYGGVTAKAIREAELVQKRKGKLMEGIVEYSELENLKYYCRKNEIKVVKEEYLENVVFQIEITEENYEKIKSDIDNFKLKVVKLDKITDKYI